MTGMHEWAPVGEPDLGSEIRGAQPEQLVEEARRLAGWGDFDMERVDWGEMLAHLHARNEALSALATALSECRGRERRLLFIAQHLFEMVSRDAWREHGAEYMGQYEGDHHAEQLRQELEEFALAAQPPSEASEAKP